MCNDLALKLHTRGKQGEKLYDHIFCVIRNQRNLEEIKQRDTTRIYFLCWFNDDATFYYTEGYQLIIFLFRVLMIINSDIMLFYHYTNYCG